MTTPPSRYGPHLVMVALIAIWAGSFTVAKVALETLTGAGLVAVRFWLGVLCLLPFLRGGAVAQLRAAFVPGMIAGTALGTGYLLQMKGIAETSAATGGLLAGLIVPLVALGGFVFFRARLGGPSLAGLALAIAGIVLICLPAEGAGTADGRVDTLYGIVMQIGSSASYAAHVLLLSRFGRSAPIAAFAFWQLLLTAIVGSVVAASEGGITKVPGATIDWDPQLVLLVVYLGVLATAMGIGVQSKVQHRVPPTPLALLFALQPLFAAICGWAVLGDRLGAMQIGGGALIVLGVVVTAFERPAAAAAPSPVAPSLR